MPSGVYQHKPHQGFQKGHKISVGHHFNKGKRLSPRTEFKKGHSLNKGRKMSDETKKKMSKSRIGKAGFWKGKKRPDISQKLRKENPKTDESKLWRKRIEYRLWREAIFARDNWTCQKCGTKGGRLHPHHKQNFAQYPELRFAIDNGITLSEKAHKEFHKKYGIKNNTREQVEEFL